MLRGAYAVAAVLLSIGAYQGPTAPPVVPTSADLALWQDAFGTGEITRRFAVVQETIRPDNVTGRLRRALDSADLTRDERALIEKLQRRNAAVVALPSSLAGSLGARFVDPASILRPSTDNRDYDAIFRMSQQIGLKLAWFSLPAFSDDGRRAALYMEWTGGFDDAGGEGFFMERREGRWVRVPGRGFALWIT
jgi:hypothetical protein